MRVNGVVNCKGTRSGQLRQKMKYFSTVKLIDEFKTNTDYESRLTAKNVLKIRTEKGVITDPDLISEVEVILLTEMK